MALGRLTIDLDVIAANWLQLRKMVAPAACAAVVKADAYGLGVAPVAARLAEAGCVQFFVATMDEGIALRSVLADVAIAVLGEPVVGQEQELLEHNLQPVLNHPGDLEAWRFAGKGAAAWLHLDTGMHRLGFSPVEWQALIAAKPDWRALGIAGLISHYACADEPDHPLNVSQRAAAHAAAEQAGLPLSLGNSSGIFLGPDFRGNMVRPGMALYGLNPTPGKVNPMGQPVTLGVQIVQVRDVSAVGTAGYGAGAAVRPGQTLATVGLGYADGLHRALSSKGAVYIDGARTPIVSRVSMDSIIVDVTNLSQRPSQGDWAEVIGPSQSADAIADAAGTIGYEILTSLGQRYARTYKRSN